MSPVFKSYVPLLRIAENQAKIDRQWEVAIRALAVIAALFLYVAFFTTLTSATISVIEELALESP